MCVNFVSCGFLHLPGCVRGGINNGDRHLPIFGDMQIVLPPALLLAIDAKLLWEGLGVFISGVLSVEAGDEQRASKLIARIGLGERE